MQLSINSQILRDKLLTNSEEFGKISGKSAYKKSAYNTNGLENTFEKENLYESKKKIEIDIIKYVVDSYRQNLNSVKGY